MDALAASLGAATVEDASDSGSGAPAATTPAPASAPAPAPAPARDPLADLEQFLPKPAPRGSPEDAVMALPITRERGESKAEEPARKEQVAGTATESKVRNSRDRGKRAHGRGTGALRCPLLSACMVR